MSQLEQLELLERMETSTRYPEMPNFAQSAVPRFLHLLDSVLNAVPLKFRKSLSQIIIL